MKHDATAGEGAYAPRPPTRRAYWVGGLLFAVLVLPVVVGALIAAPALLSVFPERPSIGHLSLLGLAFAFVPAVVFGGATVAQIKVLNAQGQSRGRLWIIAIVGAVFSATALATLIAIPAALFPAQPWDWAWFVAIGLFPGCIGGALAVYLGTSAI